MKTNNSLKVTELPPARHSGMPAEVTPKASPKTHGPSILRNSNGNGKVGAYRAACDEADKLTAARGKCRELIDLVLEKSPEEAPLLGQAMVDVGAAACRDLGDPQATAFHLGHLSRRIRERSSFDF